MDFDYFGAVEKSWISTLQRHQNHQNPLSTDPVQGHIMIWSRWDKDSAGNLNVLQEAGTGQPHHNPHRPSGEEADGPVERPVGVRGQAEIHGMASRKFRKKTSEKNSRGVTSIGTRFKCTGRIFIII